ncbi:hydantoinase/oxoprolinase family protein [Sciscionella marina]|uniref:hydantoinase/oxoprolinase family protein n=1 Tax=Sciscionella marina TaxID=508770 RepID=UPI0003749594|nr:hydantoinase/oxoprolinase family protein [Sciscionella marina]
MSTYSIGSDVGGTFTDVVVVERETGRLAQFKSPTTPNDVSEGIIAALRLAAAAEDIELRELLENTEIYSQGTTVATNILVQRRGAKIGLLQTAGFGDTMFIQRAGSRTAGVPEAEIKLFSKLVKPAPIVERDMVVELHERVDVNGTVLAELSRDEVSAAVADLREGGAEAIAVSLLWSFKNDVHERLIREVVEAEAPGLYLTLSSELLPRIREYERTVTTVINSYVGPELSRSLGTLAERLKQEGMRVEPLLMQSHGGLASFAKSMERGAGTLMSGPAGGVAGSAYLGELLDQPNIVTADMGGTSFDVGIVVDQQPHTASEAIIDKYLTGMSSVKVSAIGAGGGSIAKVVNGYLEVGPESAGAVPGPACYAQGGEDPTVTDADVVLGIIDPDYFLGGRLKLDARAAWQAVKDKVATPLGVSVEEAAEAIKSITDNKMADLIRRATIEQGYDPREFVIFGYGGAGPTHAAGYGEEVGAKAIIVPATAASHSAYGIATSDLRVTTERSQPMAAPPLAERFSEHFSHTEITEIFDQLDAQARQELAGQGGDPGEVVINHVLDMRFRGQIYEVSAPVQNTSFTAADVDDLKHGFVRAYESLYGEGSAYAPSGIEIVTFRAQALIRNPKPALSRHRPRSGAGVEPARERTVFLRGEHTALPVYEGENLASQDTVTGPALIDYTTTTAFVDSGQRAVVDDLLNLVITKEN